MKIEKLKDFVQSANVNFLIGSGLSCPFLPTLGNIETQLATIKNLPKVKQKGVAASLYREYFEKVIAPNLIQGEIPVGYSETLNGVPEYLECDSSQPMYKPKIQTGEYIFDEY